MRRGGGWGRALFFLLVSLLWTQPPFMSVCRKSLLNNPIKPAEVCVYVKRDLTDIWLPGWHHSRAPSFSSRTSSPLPLAGLSAVNPCHTFCYQLQIWVTYSRIAHYDSLLGMKTVPWMCLNAQWEVGEGEKIKREEERSWGNVGEGKKTIGRSVIAEEASPDLDLRVMISPADCISHPDCSNRADFDISASHLHLKI